MYNNFLDYLRFELNRASLTVEAYNRDIHQFAEWLGKDNPDNLDFPTISASDIRAWMAFLARNGETPRTIRRKSQSLRALFKWLQKSGHIKISPMRDIPLPKLSKPLPDLVRPQEVEEALLTNRPNEDDDNPKSYLQNLIVEMLYTLGIRRAELIALNDSDISFSNGEIKVTGKRSKQRVIPVAEDLLQKIKKWQSIRENNPDSDPSSTPLFVIKGKRISPTQVYYMVHKSLAPSSAKKKSPHALRHSFASAMLNGGANLDSVKEFLGHASLATTQIYTHISLNEIKKAYLAAHPRSDHNKK